MEHIHILKINVCCVIITILSLIN
ncbi:hypothetical protein FMEAI12_940002 [Parafrankia sp. Ea1.12]|nr:hypothetical protein FMEAI12_940002 [Parafrankia sp. Ea1.12]